MGVTLEQQRAAFAWQCSQDGISAANEKYKKLAKSAPSLIMTSGLMQTLAYLRDKNEAHHQALLSHIALWLSDRFDREATTDPTHPFPAKGQKYFEPLMQALFHAKPVQYQRATAEAMALLRWVRQMAATF